MNKHRYKPLQAQTMVITGATSGIGLATAQRAARYGARLVLAARNEDELKNLCFEISQSGGKAAYVVADVGEEQDVQKIADKAVEEFGGFDTWVNNAGVVVFSELQDLPIEDHQQIFQTNYWGVVYGSRIAQKHFKTRDNGGSIINIASINAEMPVPILGAYSASKAAVKAYSDVLRMELLHEKAPVKVTVVMPSGIATPISDHGRSYMEDRGKIMPPLYDPELVAEAILTAAQKYVRQITVGETGRISMLAWDLVPSVMDRVISWALPRVQSSGKPKSPTDNLYSADEDGAVYLNQRRQGLMLSPYTQARLHPKAALGVATTAVAVGLVAFKLIKGR
ncbi:SDR family oxidoreductase [Halopseudomonas pelagia]|uniref:SDR family NAD(P)-dependent oxidoreductase n=1 Tax=Halopseudomonas pelagia TaxID=553151 RepID=A0AA91Z524_9GAMM|nr:SDR family oxidoreductase [Halopseudomonas pelagia]PCC98296.1 short-chain dehydrogenase [Halopseudomonas pelagia]QFY56689.1 SDR family NAD(P)-dependent oxidoreductase [Halopseudomonas pelagia]